MADFQFNIAKGRVAQYFANVIGNSPTDSAIIAVPLETAGIEAQATLADYDELNALLGAANNEQTTMGRKTLVHTDVSHTITDASDLVELDLVASITWTAATGNAISRVIFCYDPDTTGGTDNTIIPLLAYDLVATPDGSDIVVSAHANGLIRF